MPNWKSGSGQRMDNGFESSDTKRPRFERQHYGRQQRFARQSQQPMRKSKWFRFFGNRKLDESFTESLPMPLFYFRVKGVPLPCSRC
jgi:hypothetical protein